MSLSNWFAKAENYKLSVGLYKALFAFLQVSLGIGAGVVTVNPPASFPEFQQTWPAFVLALVSALLKLFTNYRKQAVKGKVVFSSSRSSAND